MLYRWCYMLFCEAYNKYHSHVDNFSCGCSTCCTHLLRLMCIPLQPIWWKDSQKCFNQRLLDSHHQRKQGYTYGCPMPFGSSCIYPPVSPCELAPKNPSSSLSLEHVDILRVPRDVLRWVAVADGGDSGVSMSSPSLLSAASIPPSTTNTSHKISPYTSQMFYTMLP